MVITLTSVLAGEPVARSIARWPIVILTVKARSILNILKNIFCFRCWLDSALRNMCDFKNQLQR